MGGATHAPAAVANCEDPRLRQALVAVLGEALEDAVPARDRDVVDASQGVDADQDPHVERRALTPSMRMGVRRGPESSSPSPVANTTVAKTSASPLATSGLGSGSTVDSRTEPLRSISWMQMSRPSVAENETSPHWWMANGAAAVHRPHLWRNRSA